MPLGPRPQFKIIGYPFLVALLLDLYSPIPEQLVCHLPFQMSIPNLFDRDLNMVKQNLKKCVTLYQQLTPHCKVVQQHSIFKVKCDSCLNNFAQNTRTWLRWQKSSTLVLSTLGLLNYYPFINRSISISSVHLISFYSA